MRPAEDIHPQLRRMRRVSRSGKYAGPCPFCQAGIDRFVVWLRAAGDRLQALLVPNPLLENALETRRHRPNPALWWTAPTNLHEARYKGHLLYGRPLQHGRG